jgi:Domain of unknown function
VTYYDLTLPTNHPNTSRENVPVCARGMLELPRYNAENEIKKAETVNRNLAIISVLIATVTFAASFAMPGGYISDAGTDRGAPVLSERYLFRAFNVANVVAFLSSIVATSWLIYAGSSNVDFNLRMKCLVFSVQMVKLSTKATGAAFALAIGAVLYQVNYPIAMFIIVVTIFLLLFSNPGLDAYLIWIPILKRQRLRFVKSVNPMTRNRVNVGTGQKFSYLFFHVNVGVGQKFSTTFIRYIMMDVLLVAVIFLLALIKRT